MPIKLSTDLKPKPLRDRSLNKGRSTREVQNMQIRQSWLYWLCISVNKPNILLHSTQNKTSSSETAYVVSLRLKETKTLKQNPQAPKTASSSRSSVLLCNEADLRHSPISKQYL